MLLKPQSIIKYYYIRKTMGKVVCSSFTYQVSMYRVIIGCRHGHRNKITHKPVLSFPDDDGAILVRP